MRIAYDVGSLMGQRTGIGHYAGSLLRALMELDPEMNLQGFAVTSRSGTPTDLAGMEVMRVPVPGRLGVTVWTSIGAPPGERWLGDLDVVHGTNFWVPPLRKRNGIVTIHDLTFMLYPELCTPQIQRYRRLIPKVLESCALVLTPSDTVRNEVAQLLKFPKDRIVVTPEGVRGSFVDARKDPESLKRLGIARPYLLFAGTQEPRKNLDRTIEAVALLPRDLEVQLVIAGPSGWGSEDLKAVVKKLHLEQRVVFLGYLEDALLGSVMSGAQAFVFPSIYEGFGLPPLEAMAAGIPVVAAKAGSLPEVLGDVPFYCDPLDVSSIAEAMGEALSNEALRRSSIEAGRTRAASFTWDRTAVRTREAYIRAMTS